MLFQEISANLEVLDRFLRSGRAPTEGLTLSGLDGFLTAICVGPEIVPQSEWMAAIWGSATPEFADEAEAEAILGLIMGRYDEISRKLVDGTIEPILLAAPDGSAIAKAWADGFGRAIRLRLPAWQPMFNSKRDYLLLVPILAASGGAGEALFDLPPEDEDSFIAAATEYIPRCVLGISAFWRRHELMELAALLRLNPPQTPHLLPPKTGRNEPCPCGSGRKFKRCCGQRAIASDVLGQL
jgi:uncharacterized protein